MGRPRGPLWASVGAWASVGLPHIWCAKSPRGPEVGAGLEPLDPDGGSPLMMIESPPPMVCVCNSGPCGVIGLGHRWTGPPVDWGHRLALCHSGTGATVGLGPCGAMEGPVGAWKALRRRAWALHGMQCGGLSQSRWKTLKRGPSSFCNDLCNNLTTNQKGTKRKLVQSTISMGAHAA